MKTPPRANPVVSKGEVTVAVTRKHSVRQFETLDVFVSATSSIQPGEDQSEAQNRVYESVKTDIVNFSEELLRMCKTREL